MNVLDLILLLPILFGFVRGLQKGLLQTLGTLLGYITGFLAALYFYDTLASYAHQEMGWGTGSEIKVLSFAVLFLVPVLILKLLSNILTKTFNWLSLGPINYLLGAIAGVLKSVSFVLAFVYLTRFLKEKIQLELPDFFNDSVVYDFFLEILEIFINN